MTGQWGFPGATNAAGKKRKVGDPRCGTTAGHARHTAAGEKPCDACARAKQEYDADWRSQPENVLRNRLSAKAQARAHNALMRLHKDEYDAIYAAEKRNLFGEHGLAPRVRGSVE